MKKSNDVKVKSYIWVYCICWIAWILMLLRTFYFKRQYSFSLLIGYMVGIWILVAIFAGFETRRLLNYIKKVYPDEMEEMKSKSFTGISISSTVLSDFVSKRGVEDKKLKQLDNNYTICRIFAVVVFFSIGVLSEFILRL